MFVAAKPTVAEKHFSILKPENFLLWQTSSVRKNFSGDRLLGYLWGRTYMRPDIALSLENDQISSLPCQSLGFPKLVHSVATDNICVQVA